MQRATNFATAFTPTLPLELPALTEADWRKSVKRFKTCAATGADGMTF